MPCILLLMTLFGACVLERSVLDRAYTCAFFKADIGGLRLVFTDTVWWPRLCSHRDLASSIRVGPPLFFVVKDLNVSIDAPDVSSVCAISGCAPNSMLNQVRQLSVWECA